VYSQFSDGWEKGELGTLWRPKFFVGGVAVHGENNVPGYPASHGCVRLSNPAMDMIWAQNYMPLGSTVFVHD
jgi:lipoprotein-anchoring transpeptidase ErfK/SrfK